jgi:multicomponent Na+:H+ antiporter subunit B
MNDASRILMFAVGGLGLALLLVCGFVSLPGFGRYPGPYGDVINTSAPFERQVTNVVTAINFDYRALDTLGEEFILFGAVSGIVLLLRGKRGESSASPPQPPVDGRFFEPRSDAISCFSLILVAVINLFGTYMVLHGNLTPGGGFQGGAILGTASMLVYIAGGYRAYRKSTSKELTEVVEAVAAGSYSLIGIGSMLAGQAFLTNVLPLGTRESLLSGGDILLINFAVGLEVAAGFALLFVEFLEQTRASQPARAS